MRLHIYKLKIQHYLLAAVILVLLYRLLIYREVPDIYIENVGNDLIEIEFYPAGSIDTLKHAPQGYSLLNAIVEIKQDNHIIKDDAIERIPKQGSMQVTLKKGESVNITYFKGIGGLQEFNESHLKYFFDKVIVRFSYSDSIIAADEKSIQQLFRSSKLKCKIQ
ncbi:MAG: hypothetical protein IPP56_14610 [Bacteroidetes bacterium]|nr:hypothetical protein [Bacteroidota bacterium]MBK9672779.1 hypothetical protein [Bacteroidota bacterium]MBK9800893.1 hypothetical protein [Bacteroidota bacterium]MBP6412038.1 hypothetical protein [Bacteroidia bacterium]